MTIQIRDLFLRVLGEYVEASKGSNKGHVLAHLIRSDFKAVFKDLLVSDRYIFKGSAGQGNWGKVPWIATMDRLITDSAMRGYYVTFLFKADMSGVYLNLNQGVTDIQKLYKRNAKQILEFKAADYYAQLGSMAKSWEPGTIYLGEDITQDAVLYEHGSICHKFYAKENFPSNEQILSDYMELVSLYNHLVENDERTVADDEKIDATEEDLFFEENTKRKRLHERIDRNGNLAKAVKRTHGYKCQICTFDFEKIYGAIGKGYIEAHHLVPLSEVKDKILPLNPKKDFMVLCANCHRMVHRLDDVSDIKKLQKIFEKNPLKKT